ncbi:5'-methylthioadenosine/adenosylhomocysteine nucleosidase [Malaciobacter marinus]|uniref:adenosylhomocysteine nucleosidase n=1 Tax=Malaciobacter marinus TaxID=505249 RepID=A0A347TMB7_9BACT|nr:MULTISPECIES: 5'-methylthioadenosine/adenosylhomocysteine nucleosidase [Malaciobacter]AXX87745.1 multifunctional 5'-methylthioadenosine / S-adenosylhomocysteine nucleosidase / 6-amino-6-deoxyfutalosine hydrolase [Malaciobacter marinus]PHO12428.1 5'-methylthioadenosine/S-adenosylhomocysteine nucleosidase [Malaciobacter marinus]PHO16562.1 5'-methylthioadenosine/S-adenosylhomocysteine nucleosidase [Malaciobacter marinus]RYA22963.1 5'-methylthioadenosine/adenosylhomocysteine nucleosidase [Malaci
MNKLAIMGAMQEEIEPLLANFEDIKVTEYADNKYYEVSLDGLDIVIAHSKIGKVFASLTATTMIEKFSCDTLLFSGVAGAVNNQLKIGDLIIADKLCQHDLDITAFGHPHGFVPGGKVFVETSQELRNVAKEVAEENSLKVIEGTIATGDQFVHSNERKDFIQNTFKADALEMEGASVAVICDSLNIPFFILRSISDSADMEANFDFDEFLKSSAQISADYILKIAKKLNK